MERESCFKSWVGLTLLCVVGALHAEPTTDAWQNRNIGPVASGGARFTEEILLIEGSGSGLGNTAAADSLHYVWQPLSGDQSLEAGLNPKGNAAIGLLITSEAGAAIWFGLDPIPTIHTRSQASQPLLSKTFPDKKPTWFALRRAGETFVAEVSEDHLTWTELHRITLPATPSRLEWGVALHGKNATAEVEGLALTLATESEESTEEEQSTTASTEPWQSTDQSPDQQVAGTKPGSSKIIGSSTPSTLPVALPRSNFRRIYVNKIHGNDLFDGTVSLRSGTKGPKRSLKAALATARNGDEIRVSPGSYTLRELSSPNGEVTITRGGDRSFIGGKAPRVPIWKETGKAVANGCAESQKSS